MSYRSFVTYYLYNRDLFVNNIIITIVKGGLLMETVTLKVSGMSCSHCENAVKNAAMSIKGVKSAEASAEYGLVKIEHEGADLKAIADAIAEEGYDVVD
jgi:copper chaperone